MQNLKDHLGILGGGLSKKSEAQLQERKVLVQTTVNVGKKIKTKKTRGKFIVKILSKYFYIKIF